MFIGKPWWTRFMPAWDRAGEGESGGEGGETGAKDDGDAGDDGSGGKNGSFFKAGEGAESEGEGDKREGDRPDWLLEKYKTPEDQAKAYNELFKAYNKKTDELKADLSENIGKEAVDKHFKDLGVPEDVKDYAYPEGVNAPGEELDGPLRDWAKKNNVSADAFQSLVSDVWMKTQPDYATEVEALGGETEANKRAEAVSKWVSKNIESKHHEAVAQAMTTAAGVEMLESLMKKGASLNFAPGDGDNAGSEPLTRESIREKQADPRYGPDEQYTKYVRDLWRKFANQK